MSEVPDLQNSSYPLEAEFNINCFPGYYSSTIVKEFRHFALVFLLTKEKNTASFPGLLGQ